MQGLREQLDKLRSSVKRGTSQKNAVGNAQAGSAGELDSGGGAAVGQEAEAESVSRLVVELKKQATKEGAVLDHYRVEEELGRGAFARVYRGIQRKTGQEVAIKVVSLRHIADKALVERRQEKDALRRAGKHAAAAALPSARECEVESKVDVLRIMASEVAVMKRIARIPARSTRNIVGLKDVLVSDKQVCVVMELLSGGELFDRIISKKHFSERDAAFHVRRIMRALRVLHQYGIVHRDLKPENFVFESADENAHIKIADFGLACVLGEPDIHEGSVVGSPGYMAPEVLERHVYSPACDVWSMGVILYILFVGGPPFSGRSERETFNKIRQGQYGYPRSAKVSLLAKDLVAKCLVVDPERRISVDRFLSHPWLLQNAATADAHIGLERLRTFNVQTKVKALTTGFVWGAKSGLRNDLLRLLEQTAFAGGLTGEQVTVIRSQLLRRRVETNSSSITRDAFVREMKQLGYVELPLEQVYNLFDTAHNDRAEVAEIVVGLSCVIKDWDGGSLMRFCFETYDREGTGKVNVTDVANVLRVVQNEAESRLAQWFKKGAAAAAPLPEVHYRDSDTTHHDSAEGEGEGEGEVERACSAAAATAATAPSNRSSSTTNSSTNSSAGSAHRPRADSDEDDGEDDKEEHVGEPDAEEAVQPKQHSIVGFLAKSAGQLELFFEGTNDQSENEPARKRESNPRINAARPHSLPKQPPHPAQIAAKRTPTQREPAASAHI
jgi:serine/threonine protein kinase